MPSLVATTTSSRRLPRAWPSGAVAGAWARSGGRSGPVQGEEELDLALVSDLGGAAARVVDAVVGERDGDGAVDLDAGAVAARLQRKRHVPGAALEREPAG